MERVDFRSVFRLARLIAISKRTRLRKCTPHRFPDTSVLCSRAYQPAAISYFMQRPSIIRVNLTTAVPSRIYSLGPFSSEHCLAWNTCSLNTWGYFIQKFSPDGGYSSGENVTSSLFCSFFLLPGNWSNENCVSTIAPLALCQRILSFNPFKKKIQCIRVLIYIVETINFYTFDKMNFIQLIYIISQDISSRNSIVTRI